MNSIDIIVDVREISPRLRHPTIFKTWDEMPTGAAISLVNDHDPLPLYYQFAAEYTGHFRWEYVEKGPSKWNVRISKGEFSDPGFVPTKKASTSCVPAQPISFVRPVVLDTRPIFDRGDTPCHAIDEAAANVIPGQTLTLIVPFEPIPLFAKLGKMGFQHNAKKLPDGAWQVDFVKGSASA
jgi:uncharacterized protein (DUF2249 family)